MRRLSFVDRFLTLWIFPAMAILGRTPRLPPRSAHPRLGRALRSDIQCVIPWHVEVGPVSSLEIPPTE